MRLPVTDQLEWGLEGIRPVVALFVCEKKNKTKINNDLLVRIVFVIPLVNGTYIVL